MMQTFDVSTADILPVELKNSEIGQGNHIINIHELSS